jgi:hypothetical protein
MTVAIAWVRTLGACEELVFASDSRLSGDGRNFDGCAKILTLPRNDCVIAFAGYSGHAFPMMLQLDLAIDSYLPAKRGALDISSLRKHALKVFDSMADMIHSSPKTSIKQDVNPEASFLFGGYSWVKKRFDLWSIAYSASEHRFQAHPAEWIGHSEGADKFLFRKTTLPKGTERYSKIAFAGDQSLKARSLLAAHLASKHSKGKAFTGIDWEPFEVVREMLRDPKHSETIGGAPQVVKVYQYMRTAPLGVYWPNKKKGSIYLQGRPCLGYERIDRWILDPDTMVSESPQYTHSDQQLPEAIDPSAKNDCGE